MKSRSVDLDVLASAFSEVMPRERARSLAITALAHGKSLPGVLASNRPDLTNLRFDAAAIDVVRQLGDEMQRSLARSFAGQSVRQYAAAFQEYLSLLRASLAGGQVRLLLFDGNHALTADILCCAENVRTETPTFSDVLQQSRLAKAQAYMLVHRKPAGTCGVFVNRLTTCCIAAGLIPFATELEPVDQLQQRVRSI